MEKSATFLWEAGSICKSIKNTITQKLHIGRNCVKTIQFNFFDNSKSFITLITLIKSRVISKFLYQNSGIILYW